MAAAETEVVVAEGVENHIVPNQLADSSAKIESAPLDGPGYPGALHPDECVISLLRDFWATGRRRI